MAEVNSQESQERPPPAGPGICLSTCLGSGIEVGQEWPGETGRRLIGYMIPDAI